MAITPFQRRLDKGSSALGTIGKVAGVVGGALAAIPTGGATLPAVAAGVGALGAGATAADAFSRKAAQPGPQPVENHARTIEDALSAVRELPQEEQQQYAPPLLDAYMLAMKKRGPSVG